MFAAMSPDTAKTSLPPPSDRAHPYWVGKRLREAREKAGFHSQAAAARELGVERQSLNRWENGHGRPTYENLRAAATLFKTDADYLAYGEEAVRDRKKLKGVEDFEISPAFGLVPLLTTLDNGRPNADLVAAVARWIAPEFEVGRRAFAWTITSGELGDRAPPGALVIIDPDVTAEPGVSLVMVYRPRGGKVLFGRYEVTEIDRNGHEISRLAPLAPGRPMIALAPDGGDKIVGVITEIRSRAA